MKINELNEGPVDFAKKVGAGVKGLAQGGLRGAKLGWNTQGAVNKQQDLTKNVAYQAGLKWAEYNQKIKGSTGKDATPDQAVAWLTQFQGGVAPISEPTGSSAKEIDQWLQKEVDAYMAKKDPGYSAPLPDISKLTREQLLQLKQQLLQAA